MASTTKGTPPPVPSKPKTRNTTPKEDVVPAKPPRPAKASTSAHDDTPPKKGKKDEDHNDVATQSKTTPKGSAKPATDAKLELHAKKKSDPAGETDPKANGKHKDTDEEVKAPKKKSSKTNLTPEPEKKVVEKKVPEKPANKPVEESSSSEDDSSDSESSSEPEKPVAKPRGPVKPAPKPPVKKPAEESEEETSEEDETTESSTTAEETNGKAGNHKNNNKKPAKPKNESESDDSEEDSEPPGKLPSPKKTASKPKGKQPSGDPSTEHASTQPESDDTPASNKPVTTEAPKHDDGKKKGGFFSFFKKGKKEKPSGSNDRGSGHAVAHREGTPSDKRKAEETKQTFVVSCVTDLPEDWQKKLRKAHLEVDSLNKHFAVLCNVLHFLTKHSFRIPEGEKETRERRTYASADLMEKAKLSMDTTDNIKKFYKNIEFSGKGGFGRVFAAKDIQTKKRVAIKKLPHSSDKDKKNNYCEIAFLSTCNHPNIVKFVKSWDFADKGEAWIVTEFLEGGTLSEATKVHQFSERHIAYVAREMLKALKYLHGMGYVHRDLKSGNVMMSIEGHIKLIDFGLCCDTIEGPRLQMLGSPYWIPPEMIQKKRHGCPADIWSFAVCVLEMYLKEPPNCESRLFAMFTAASAGLKDAIPARASDHARDFLSHCLELNPKKRWTSDQLLEHPFVTQPKLEEGIRDVLRGVFVSNSLALSGI